MEPWYHLLYMKNTQRGFLVGFVWVVVIILVVGFGIYVYLKNNPTTQVVSLADNVIATTSSVATSGSVVSSQTNSTASWRTYKSSTYDYEIKYPSEYDLSWNNSPVSKDVLGVDVASYINKNYDINFQIFARNGFVLDDCLKDLSGKNITKVIAANGNNLYVYNDHEKGLGGRMALTEGAIRSEYHAIHNGYCYILTYTIDPTYPTSLSPSQMEEKVNTLDKVISTFKFTK